MLSVIIHKNSLLAFCIRLVVASSWTTEYMSFDTDRASSKARPSKMSVTPSMYLLKSVRYFFCLLIKHEAGIAYSHTSTYIL